MNILGIYDGHNSNAALIFNGSIRIAAEEERFSRKKNHDSRDPDNTGPQKSISACLAHLDGKLDCVVVALEEPEIVGQQALARYRESIESGLRRFIPDHKIDGVDVNRYPFQHHQRRIGKIKATLAECGVDANAVKFAHVHHHRAHAASVYYTSGMQDALIVTLDGKGDNLCGTVSLGHNGKITTLHEIDYLHSLGHFYTAVTVALGYKALQHEGKVTGLAARGKVNPEMLEAFQKLFRVEGGTIISRLNAGLPVGPYPDTLYSQHLERIKNIIGRYSHEDVAATAQKVLEDVVCDFIGHHLKQYGASHLLVTGGIFANVRLNQKLAELAGVKVFRVHPAMSDAGLGVGAALEIYYRDRPYVPCAIQNAFLGVEYSEAAMESVLRRMSFNYTKPQNIAEAVAQLLANGEVVCRYNGRSEYGPRALGNRSILYRADDPSANTWLNRQHLKRTETMPFAPMTLDAHMDENYRVIPAARGCDEFMTITYNCTPVMRDRSSGVVHLDGTARPQRLVQSANPSMHAILGAYHRLTGIPTIINTSFNIHGEPIVETPYDAARSFISGRFKYMQMGPFIVNL